MPAIEIDGITVEFPFTPYDVQKAYMTKVIQALNNNQNAALESPTGTGKTLCLLCSTLAWRKSKLSAIKQHHQTPTNSDEGWYQSDSLGESPAIGVPKIIYASRTHSQISQVVKELKRTEYGKNITISILGSREQMCVHPEVSKQTSNQTMIHMCRSKVNKHICQFYNNVEDAKKNNLFTTQVLDIEELVTVGKSRHACPYYSEREVSKQNDCGIIFTPYNYVLDRQSRNANNLEVRGNIVIFDEAHNLEKLCEESTSFDLTSLDIANCIEEVGDVLDAATKLAESGTVADGHEMGESSSLSEFKASELALMKSVFIALEKQLDLIELDKSTKTRSENGKFMFDFFSKINLSKQTYQIMLELINKITSYLSTLSSSFRIRGAALQKFSEIVKIAFSWCESESNVSSVRLDDLCMFYRVHICENPESTKTKDVWKKASNAGSKPSRTISFWCFSPGYAMNNLVNCGVRNIILTSGTLSPLESFTSELQIDFPVTLENDHVIDKHQVFVVTLSKGKMGGSLSSTFKTRQDTNHIEEIGHTVVDLIAASPGGALVFFPSYSAMATYMAVWKDNSNVMSLMESAKPCSIEPRNKHNLKTSIEKYYSNVSSGGGAFLAVCRGKVSEGLDFSDNNGRTVVIIGIPFPPMMDPKIKLKMAFLDDLKSKGGNKSHVLWGREWYRQQACRAVNQAIGRVIRHRYDYGAIILCDSRYAGKDQLAELPKWVQPHVIKFDDSLKCVRRLKSFFCSIIEKEKIRLRSTAECPKSAIESTKSTQINPNMGSSVKLKADQRGTGSAKLCVKYSESDQHGDCNNMYRESVLDFLPTGKRKRKNSFSDPSTSTTQKKSLLDALDNEVVEEPSFSEENVHSRNNAVQKVLPDIKKFKPRKKIIIKKSSVEIDASDTETHLNGKDQNTKDNSTSKTSMGVDSWKLANGPLQYYIESVKSVLGTKQYVEFKKIARLYTKNGDLDNVFNLLCHLFLVDSNQPEFLKSFVRFIRSAQRKQYEELVSSRLTEGT